MNDMVRSDGILRSVGLACVREAPGVASGPRAFAVNKFGGPKGAELALEAIGKIVEVVSRREELIATSVVVNGGCTAHSATNTALHE